MAIRNVFSFTTDLLNQREMQSHAIYPRTLQSKMKGLFGQLAARNTQTQFASDSL